MRTVLTYGCRLALGACLGWLPGTAARAQLLCERVLAVPATAPFMRTTGLLQPQPDSLRLLTNYGPNTSYTPTYHRITRVAVGTCDTLPLPGAAFPTPNVQFGLDFRIACTTRRGEMLVSSVQRGGQVVPGLDSALLRLTLLGRNGRVRWSRLVTGGCQTGARGLLEAPDGGFYVSGGGLMRVDSAGRMLWCRRYGNAGDLCSPTYSRRGTLLFSVLYGSGAGVLEVGQRGDSLGFTPVIPPGSTWSTNGEIFSASAEVLRPLRDGGLLMQGEADSASATNRIRPFLARLDRNLRVTWVFALPSRFANPLRMVQPFELADGTLLVLVASDYSGRGQPFWLYRLSAAGALLQRYPFTSQVLPPRIHNFANGYLGWVQGVQPLRDSSFVLASTYRDPTRNLTYLAHLRVPGLPRVLDSSFLPLAARSGAALAPEALGPPQPGHRNGGLCLRPARR